MNELILYQTPDGKTKGHLRAEEGGRVIAATENCQFIPK